MSKKNIQFFKSGLCIDFMLKKIINICYNFTFYSIVYYIDNLFITNFYKFFKNLILLISNYSKFLFNGYSLYTIFMFYFFFSFISLFIILYNL